MSSEMCEPGHSTELKQIYDHIMSTPEGAQSMAIARLTNEILSLMWEAREQTGITTKHLAEATGKWERTVRRDFDPDNKHSIRVADVAKYLQAMGKELCIELVDEGEPRRRANQKDTP